MCLFSIFKNSEWGIEFLENSVDEINNLLLNEKDISTKRNAFILLYHIDQAKALNYLWSLFNNTEDPVADLGDVF